MTVKIIKIDLLTLEKSWNKKQWGVGLVCVNAKVVSLSFIGALRRLLYSSLVR